jgi:hypothetical protein
MQRKKEKNGPNQDFSDERITMILNTWNHRLRNAASRGQKNGTTDYADYTDFFSLCPLCPLWLN